MSPSGNASNPQSPQNNKATHTSHALHEALLDSLTTHQDKLHGKRVWLACSGGRDSLSLAYACRQLFDEGKLPFLPQLLHVNHGMQVANAAWAKQVQAWAKAHDMPCDVLCAQTDDVIDKDDINNEQAARHARYQLMMDKMNDDDVLMLAHHVDDQVETVLMRLFNGAGVQGLGGMQNWTAKYGEQAQSNTHDHTVASPLLSKHKSPKHKLFKHKLFKHKLSRHNSPKKVYLWRPWLSVSRAQITEYACALRLDYIDDPTNVLNKVADDDLDDSLGDDLDDSLDNMTLAAGRGNDRAWLRSVLMPLIHTRYPQASRAIARSSELMQSAQAIMNERVHEDLIKASAEPVSIQPIQRMCGILSIDNLLAMSHARRQALIHAWLSPHELEMPPPKRLVDDVEALLIRPDNDHQTSLHWYGGVSHYQIQRYQNQLYRLRHDFLEWLQQRPPSQAFEVHFEERLGRKHDALTHIAISDDISLKRYHQIDWRLSGLTHLLQVICTSDLQRQAQAGIGVRSDSLDARDDVMTAGSIKFAPLPRQLKLTLAGRRGGKSGKKLLQALSQPSFMRESVVLCSYACPHWEQDMPLCLITTTDIVILHSPYARAISDLVDAHKLAIYLCHTD